MNYLSAELKTYVSDAAAGQPTPGGGSVSALVGALAASMGEMAANFTVGKEKFASVEQDIQRALSGLKRCRQKLLTLMEADVSAYGAVDAAYNMPKDTQEQKVARKEAIQQSLTEAMKVPLNVMRQCALVAQIGVKLAEIANPRLVTDVGVCAILAEAACAAARLNVAINMKHIKDSALVDETAKETVKLTDETARARAEVARMVEEHIGC